MKKTIETWDSFIIASTGNRVFQKERLNPHDGRPYLCTFGQSQFTKYCETNGFQLDAEYGADYNHKGDYRYKVHLYVIEKRQAILF